MGMRFRRSIKLGPGVRLNVGKKSLGLSTGVRGLRYSVSSLGRTTRTVGVPGSGLSWRSTSSGQKRSATGRPAAAATRTTRTVSAPTGPAPLPKPGLLAPQVEKRFYEGVQAYIKGDFLKALAAFEQASAKDDRNISDDLFAGFSASRLGDRERARYYFERVVASDIELPDELMQKYLPFERAEIRVSIDITPRVTAQVPFSSLAAALGLAELYQQDGMLEEAIGLLQQLAETFNNAALNLSLCDLLYEDGDDEAVIDVASGVANDSDIGLATLHLKAKALARRALKDGADEAFTACLKRTAGRDPELLKEVRYDKATFYAETGQASRAGREFEKLYADDSKYRDVARRVNAPSG